MNNTYFFETIITLGTHLSVLVFNQYTANF